MTRAGPQRPGFSLSPPYDSSEITALLAVNLVYEPLRAHLPAAHRGLWMLVPLGVLGMGWVSSCWRQLRVTTLNLASVMRVHGGNQRP